MSCPVDFFDLVNQRVFFAGDLAGGVARIIKDEEVIYDATRAFILSYYKKIRDLAAVQREEITLNNFCEEIVPQVRSFWEWKKKHHPVGFLFSIAQAHRIRLLQFGIGDITALKDQSENIFFGKHMHDTETTKKCDDESLQLLYLIGPVLEKVFESYLDRYLEEQVYDEQIGNVHYYTRYGVGNKTGVARKGIRDKIKWIWPIYGLITGAAMIWFEIRSQKSLAESSFEAFIKNNVFIPGLIGCFGISCFATLLPRYLYPSKW